jgi:hypothetical protein
VPAVGRMLFLAALGLPLMCGGAAEAHGLVAYASTPIAPPSGYLWVAACWVALLVAVNAVFVKRRGLDNWPRAIGIAFGTAFMFAVVVIGIGLVGNLFLSGLTGAPFPGFPPFYGIAWSMGSVIVFCFWNLVGVVLLGRAVRIHIADEYGLGDPDRRRLFRVNALVYAVGLLPFLVSGALTHGWTGGHVSTECYFGRMYKIGEAILDYSDAHDGHLPPGADMAQVRVELMPYLHTAADGREEGPDYPFVCPARAALERHPRLYTWHADMSGKSLDELRALPGKTPIVSCDFRGPLGIDHDALTVEVLLRIERQHQGAL